jgi:hypothetical protein
MLTAAVLQDRLISSGLCEAHKLRGCSEKDLQRIEKHVGQALPKAYKDLMRVMGRHAGDFMSDIDMYYPGVVKLTDRTRPLVAEEGVELPDDAYVFASRYGEQVFFFRLGTGKDDPEIYKWDWERPKAFRRIFKSIWGLIEEDLEAHEQLLDDSDL